MKTRRNLRPSTARRLGPATTAGAVALATALLALAAATPAARAQIVVPPACPVLADPTPSGVTDRPNVVFDTWPDYEFVHSSTHLQGERATEKFAAGLLWNPPSPAELSGFRSVVVVTNPDPVASASVRVEFYDESGNGLGAVPRTIPPEGFTTVAASLLSGGIPAGRGSARIVSTDGVPIVGETIHHTLSVNLSAFGGPTVTDPDAFNPGATSLQQLQVPQSDATALFGGPFPTSDQSPVDVLNGNAPLFWVMNPNPTPTTVNIGVFSRLGVNLGTTAVVLPPFTTHLDLRLWNNVWGPYLSGSINYDDDFFVVASADQPILGEVVMTDLFGNGSGPGDHLRLGDRFRMGSAMLATSPALRVISPELTFQPTNVGVQTVIGLTNAAAADIGPVRIEYFDRNGALLASSSISTFPQAAVARIGPGLPSSPSYPTGPVFDGWIRITACEPGLLGWTMHTAGDEAGAPQPPFRKIWGEALAGANGTEPGDGFPVTVGGRDWIRKASSIVRVQHSFPFFWPGYTTFVNHSVANVGDYWYRFFRPSGQDVTLMAGQPFAGVQFADTSFTFEDPLVDSAFVTLPENLSGRVDHETGRIQGIHVIGDPMVEWDIFNPVDPDEVEPIEPQEPPADE